MFFAISRDLLFTSTCCQINSKSQQPSSRFFWQKVLRSGLQSPSSGGILGLCNLLKALKFGFSPGTHTGESNSQLVPSPLWYSASYPLLKLDFITVAVVRNGATLPPPHTLVDTCEQLPVSYKHVAITTCSGSFSSLTLTETNAFLLESLML